MSLKTLYRKRTVIWPFYFYTIIRTLSNCYNNYWTKTLNNVNYFFILTFSAIISGHVPIRL
ncbi:hypothetical protein DVW64_11540 [Enterococcus faecium]|nr:hypothetical protein DVW64_11540 [Enterococcus faecium]